MFKERIKELRKLRHITQAQLAKEIGVDVSTIGKWEGKGNVLPSDGVKEKLAAYFGVSIDYLMCYEPAAGSVSSAAEKLLQYFNALTPAGQQLVIDYAAMLAGNESYTKETASTVSA